MMYLKAFLVGGLICVLGQILIDRTKLTPARILVLFVCVGCTYVGGFTWSRDSRIFDFSLFKEDIR